MKKDIIIKGGSFILIGLVVKFLIDYPVNFFILDFCGYILSVFIMDLINLIFCGIFVKIYDHIKIDSLGAEKSKQKKLLEKGEEIIIGKLTQLKKFGLFVLLSIKVPSFVMVIYFRPGSYLYNGFPERKIKIFVIFSILVLSIMWNLVLYSGFSLWNYLKGV